MTAFLVLILRIAAAIALYAFLGRIFSTLWQDLKQQGDFLSSQKKPGIHIHAIMENGKGIQRRYVQAEVTIGRDPNCDFPVIDEAISAQHVKISYHHSQWWLEDLNSTNGTFMGKNQVTVPTVLITSDQFRCGGTTFTILVDMVDNKLPLK
jgi:hypothetical protein